ncbi:MAG: hypothetical protein FJY67_10090 [Calditrichaeota bacterium]|nr:hypothetical protein [Calditrichota bacterium]
MHRRRKCHIRYAAVNTYPKTQLTNDLTLQVVLKERHVVYRGHYANDHYDPMVKMIPDWRGTRFSIGSGENREFSFSQSLRGLGWHELDRDNLRIVVFAQATNREVHQTAVTGVVEGMPELSLVSFDAFDENGGDANLRIERGESGQIVVRIANHDGGADVESFTATLSCDYNGVALERSEWQGGTITAGEEVTNEEAPFQIRVAEDFIAHPVTFQLEVVASPGEIRARFPIRTMLDFPPVLVVNVSTEDEEPSVLANVFDGGELPWADLTPATGTAGSPSTE